MKHIIIVLLLAAAVVASGCVSLQSSYALGSINVTWLGHSTVRLEAANNTMYIDPFVLDNGPKKADFIFITHNHTDHCSPDAVQKIQVLNDTKIIAPESCISRLSGRTYSLSAGEFDNFTFQGVYAEAFPAYNINNSYHPLGEGNGYLIEVAGEKIYVAGDTDNIPEFANLTSKNIDLLILPIGGKYTMDAKAAADAAKVIKPKAVLPVHYNSDKYGITDIHADPLELAKLLEGSGITVIVLTPAA